MNIQIDRVGFPSVVSRREAIAGIVMALGGWPLIPGRQAAFQKQ